MRDVADSVLDMWCMESEKLVCMVDAKGAVDRRGFCEVLKSQIESGDENHLRDFNGLFILQVVQL